MDIDHELDADAIGALLTSHRLAARIFERFTPHVANIHAALLIDAAVIIDEVVPKLEKGSAEEFAEFAEIRDNLARSLLVNCHDVLQRGLATMQSAMDETVQALLAGDAAEGKIVLRPTTTLEQ